MIVRILFRWVPLDYDRFMGLFEFGANPEPNNWGSIARAGYQLRRSGRSGLLGNHWAGDGLLSQVMPAKTSVRAPHIRESSPRQVGSRKKLPSSFFLISTSSGFRQ